MNSIHKELLEVNFNDLSDRLKEMYSFISNTKNFSLKVNGHLKIMANLVNNLIESDDNLTLTDTELLVGYNHNWAKKEEKQQEPTEGTDNKLLDTIMNTFKNENDKLWSFIKKSENNTDVLKSYFDRVIENRSQKERSSVGRDKGNEQKNVNNINTYPFKKNNMSVHHPKERDSPMYQSQYHHHTYHQQNIPPPYQTYREPMQRRESFPERNFSEQNRYYTERHKNFEEETYKRFESENERLKRDLNRMKKKKGDLEGELEDIQLELRKLKKENRQGLMNKDLEIEDMGKALTKMKDCVSNLKAEIERLKDDNSTLRTSIDELLSLKKDIGNESDHLSKDGLYTSSNAENTQLKEENRNLKDMNRKLREKIDGFEDEIEELKDQNDNARDFKMQADKYKTKNNELINEKIELIGQIDNLKDELEKTIERTRTQTTTKTTYDNIELLKCVYSQAHYIEDTDVSYDMSKRRR